VVTEGEHKEATDKDQLRRDREFAEREDIVGQVEAEASNATGGAVNPAEVDVTQDPELVRLGLRTLLRSLMLYLGREETERTYERAFGLPPRGRVDPDKLPTLGELRESRGDSMREFARLTGSSTRALQDAESGTRAPRAETMHKYAKALGKHPWEIREFARWLLGESRQEDDQKEEPDE
jgi:DNA-binding transcriptional regulator YiaG